jgi:hypothetical protein
LAVVLPFAEQPGTNSVLTTEHPSFGRLLPIGVNSVYKMRGFIVNSTG